MKLKELKNIWTIGSNYAILSLPIVSYAVQPHWRNRYIKDKSDTLTYTASMKAAIAIPITLEEEFSSIEDAQKACENHLEKLLRYLFLKLDTVVDLQTIN